VSGGYPCLASRRLIVERSLARTSSFARQDVFAAELQTRFPDDGVLVTRRGQAGADVTQQVRHSGRECGTILWECKRTVSWSGTWVDKLSSNTRKAGAALGVIVS
jgi:hypothetical protein